MKIALVTGTFLPKIGGAQLVIHNLANQWCGQGHEVNVFKEWSPQSKQESEDYHVTEYSVLRGTYRFGPHKFPFCQFNARSIKRQLDLFRPDYVSAHFGYPVGVWLSMIRPLPRFLVTCHGRELTLENWGYRYKYNSDSIMAGALNLSSGVVAISKFARRQMEELGVNPSKIIDIANGVDVGRFQKCVSIDIRDKFNIPRDAILILSVGRNSKDKDYATAIEAFCRVSEKHENVYYMIVGLDTDKLASDIPGKTLGGKVVLSQGLYGDELVGAYQQADLFLSSSVTELCPLVVLEALAAGLPEVVTNVSGSQDIIDNGENGFVVEPRQPEEMAVALEQLIVNSPLRKGMSAVNLKKAEQYSWENVSHLYLQHF